VAICHRWHFATHAIEPKAVLVLAARPLAVLFDPPAGEELADVPAGGRAITVRVASERVERGVSLAPVGVSVVGEAEEYDLLVASDRSPERR
jgi:hypothetical protein